MSNLVAVILWWGVGLATLVFCIWYDVQRQHRDVVIGDMVVYLFLSLFGPFFVAMISLHIMEDIKWNWQPVKDFINKPIFLAKKT